MAMVMETMLVELILTNSLLIRHSGKIVMEMDVEITKFYQMEIGGRMTPHSARIQMETHLEITPMEPMVTSALLKQVMLMRMVFVDAQTLMVMVT